MKEKIIFMVEVWIVYLAVGLITKKSDFAILASIITGMALIYSEKKGDL